MEEALDLFKLPRRLGEHEGKVVTAAIGRFDTHTSGTMEHLYHSKPRTGTTPTTVTLARAIELIVAKKAADAKALIKVFEEDETVRILEGRYGPYIKAGKKNVTIPKTEDPVRSPGNAPKN